MIISGSFCSFFITYFELEVDDLGSRRGVGDSAVYFTIAMTFISPPSFL